MLFDIEFPNITVIFTIICAVRNLYIILIIKNREWVGRNRHLTRVKKKKNV